MKNIKHFNKLNTVTKSLVVTGLLMGSTSALAEDLMEDGLNEVVYEYKDGKLQEKYGEDDFVSYTKKALPASCAALSIENITEKYTSQPSADIVGSWEMDAFMDDDMEEDNDFGEEFTGYINIKANGQIEGYDYNSNDKTCAVYNVQELDGNKLSFDDGFEAEIEASLIKAKLTMIDAQLAVVNVREETLTAEGKTESYIYPEAMIYSKSTSLPAVCDINAKVPSAESSNDNPNSALVGNWEAADIDLGEMEEQGGEYKDFYVVTGGGFLLGAFYDKEDGKESCEVVYIGETVGDQYTK